MSSVPDVEKPGPGRLVREALELRRPVPSWLAVVLALACVVIVLGIWAFVTSGPVVEERIISVIPSPSETFRGFSSLWFDRALTRNLFASLQRLVLGFGLAVVVGVPLGIACGCLPWFNAFLTPLTVFGRYIPIAALIPLTFALFGIDEFQKVMFLFLACVAFVISDSARAVAEVPQEHIDTALTLGAGRWRVVRKVLVPLAMPSIFNSARLLFGLAFGYIMLAELVVSGEGAGGIGALINISQRRGRFDHILLILMVIPVVALVIERALYWIQKQFFPYRHGGPGLLRRLWKWVGNGFEDAWDALRAKARARTTA